LLALALAPGVFGTSVSSFTAIFGDKKNAGSVTSKLQEMMGNSQQKLAIAQRHHSKVVKQSRKQAATWLQAEANVYGKYFSGYTAELEQAQDMLQAAVDEAKAGLAKAEKISEKSVNDWRDPGVEQRAKLGAQIAATERSLKKTERRTARKVEESEEHSDEVMEDHGTKLGFKLGDMTPLVDEAKKTLHAVAEAKAPVTVAKVVAKADTDSKKVDLKALEDKLAKASKNVVGVVADANKKMDGFLSKTDKDVSDKRAVIEKSIETAQTQEIAKVLGHPAPAVKKEAAKKTATKVVKATAAKVVAAKVVKPAAAKVVAANVVKPAAAKVVAANVVKPAAAKVVKAAPAKVVKPVAAKVAKPTTAQK